MAQARGKFLLTVSVVFEVDESEARALEVLSNFGADKIVESLSGSLGEEYVRDYENGLRSFLSTIRGVVAPAISAADSARALMNGSVN